MDKSSYEEILQNEYEAYYSHSKLSWNTKKEANELKIISSLSGSRDQVICPNHDLSSLGLNKMQQFFAVADRCKKFYFSAYNGYVGKGVFSEAKHALKHGKEVYMVDGFNVRQLESEDNLIIHDSTDWKQYYAKVIFDDEDENKDEN